MWRIRVCEMKLSFCRKGPTPSRTWPCHEKYVEGTSADHDHPHDSHVQRDSTFITPSLGRFQKLQWVLNVGRIRSVAAYRLIRLLRNLTTVLVWKTKRFLSISLVSERNTI